MMIPVRCFTCGAPIAQYWDEFVKRYEKEHDAGKVLDELGIKRYCCRRMFISHVNLIEELIKFSPAPLQEE